ncbi:migration and invasion-inhibitory protein [Perognathus longimembris pacificus]|uniref:migration and invasion-inhibitory protein n=1 Tax=Perognathus longimembris pacificus TaxID=214514 RepID=UPI00201A0257|nr:migration and invasion-inhibitory protein [Perognathus longimembris pacificus]
MLRRELGAVLGPGENADLEQLRLLNMELLKQLWVGQEAVERSVAKAFEKSGLDSSRSYSSETPVYPDNSSACPSTSSSQDRGQEEDAKDTPGGDPHHGAWLGRAGSRVASLPPAKCPETLGILRSRPASLPVPREPKEPPQARTPRPRRNKLFKPTVTFSQETEVPERSWRFRPYLGYDWIAGSLDSTASITSEPEAFFSRLQKFREANKEECIYTEGQLRGLHGDGDSMADDHHCVYCYRLNRRLFPVPVDPGAPCRLCGTPRDQQGAETLLEPAQVRVSVPLSILDPPHQYRIHRRKSFDSSDTLALPRHCLLGWDSHPPRSEKSSAPKSLDLWSSVSQAQHGTQPATTPSYLTLRVPASTPIWSEP